MTHYTVHCIDQFDRLFQWSYVVDERYGPDSVKWVYDYMFQHGVREILESVGSAAHALWWSEERGFE